MKLRSLSSCGSELRESGAVAVARRTVPLAAWVGVDVALCGLLFTAFVKAWMIIVVLTALLFIGLNLVMFLMHRTWMVVLGDSQLSIRAVAPPLIFRRTKDALARPSVAAVALSEVRSLCCQKIKITEAAGSIVTHWLVFDLEPETMMEMEACLSSLHSARRRLGRPVQFLLRYDSGRCFLRWDGLRPPLKEYLATIASRVSEMGEIARSEERTIDVRHLASQPEGERRLNISLMVNLGLGQLVLPLLTAGRGMSLKDATRYLDAILGEAIRGDHEDQGMDP